MADILFWVLVGGACAGAAYFYVRNVGERRQKQTTRLQVMRQEFFREHKKRWSLFYHKHKLDDGLNDEEILSRYVFTVVAELRTTPLTKVQLDLGLRSEILAAVAAAGPLTEQEIDAMTAKIDREGRKTRLDVRYPSTRSTMTPEQELEELQKAHRHRMGD